MPFDQTLPPNKSFRLRGVRITPAQEKALSTYWEKYSVPSNTVLDITTLFSGFDKTIVEIGTGMGEATWQIANTFPEFGFLCFEVHKPGLGALLAKIAELELENIKIVEADARLFLERNLANNVVDGIHLYFPDPWPKLKHWKRRIVQDEFVQLVHQKLKPKGYIHIATDWEEYGNWIKKKFDTPFFKGGEIEKPEFRPLTKFESQGIRKGHKVTDLWYVKN